MNQVKSQQLEDIENDTEYHGCAFYLDEEKKYVLENVEFDDCSFRTRVKFGMLKGCKFCSCGFSGELVVDLHKMDLEKIPSFVFELKAITELNLGGNKLTELPADICKLHALTSLGLVFNQLTELPVEITQLQTLTWLYVSGNELTELPAEIIQLQVLTHLYLRGNRLTKDHIEKIRKWLPNCRVVT